MLITLKPAAMWMHCSANFPGKKDKAAGGGFNIDVHLDERHRLYLETGEVFQSPRYARIKSAKNKSKEESKEESKDTNITASLTIREAVNPDHYDYNEMSYLEEHRSDYGNSPSQICFDVFLPPGDFHEFTSNIRSNLLPSLIRVELPHPQNTSPIQYSAPDGSEKKWSNLEKDNRRVRIKNISFHYHLLKPTIDLATGQAVATETPSISELANTIKDAIASLQRETKQLSWVVVAAGMVVAFTIAYYAKH